ncbi:hypothetical protein Bphy_4154 [Paraburkholderia phymatum STM815]|uniref:Uncharacterized protein n=1 Tax=Paraburkholderia phymatum (strain DSM 17167 / CIP 108236 / LMG 21445 / STM815) TaxID=391038 RepID=B2JPT4_PARP8|nr:hypothetical protein Bphy_4154 [Paraburkholderia phymatum STM815]
MKAAVLAGHAAKLPATTLVICDEVGRRMSEPPWAALPSSDDVFTHRKEAALRTGFRKNGNRSGLTAPWLLVTWRTARKTPEFPHLSPVSSQRLARLRPDWGHSTRQICSRISSP